MSGRRAKRLRREEMIDLLQQVPGIDRSLAERMHDAQIEPQQIADEMRDAGHDVQATFVNINPTRRVTS